MVFPRREHQLAVQSQIMVSPVYIHTDNIIQTEQVDLTNIYEYTCIHAMTMIFLKDNELEGEWGEVYGRVWRKERW